MERDRAVIEVLNELLARKRRLRLALGLVGSRAAQRSKA
jgi:hypothetical protein